MRRYGRVVDRHGRPVAGAAVTVLGTGQTLVSTTLTDELGSFYVELSALGTRIEATSDGRRGCWEEPIGSSDTELVIRLLDP